MSRAPLRVSSTQTSAAETVIDGDGDLTKTVPDFIKNVVKTVKHVPIVEGIAETIFQLIQICDVSLTCPLLLSAKAIPSGDEE